MPKRHQFNGRPGPSNAPASLTQLLHATGKPFLRDHPDASRRRATTCNKGVAQYPLYSGIMHAIQFEDLLQPEALLPVQFQHIWSGKRSITPERTLLVAILWQAADDLLKHQHARHPKMRRLYRDAYRWVASDDRTWPCSFLNICDLLGLSAGSLRVELLGSEAPRDSRAVRWRAHPSRPPASLHSGDI